MRAVEATKTVEVPQDRDLKVIIVADTHSKPHAGAFALIDEHQPDLILHAGDIGSLDVLDPLQERAETIAVRGNIDGHDPRTPDHVTLALTGGGATQMRLLLTHIAVAGPRLRRDARARAKSAQAQLVICGHSHVPFLGRDGDLSIFNPGSIGPRRFHLPITLGLMRVGAKVSFQHFDCETGLPWTPGAAVA